MNVLEQIKDGDVLYGVHEHMYYVKGEPAPRNEYVVTEEVVKKHFKFGYEEIVTSDGKTPRYYQKKHIGKTVFFKPKEAAKYAQELTAKHDQTWHKYGEPPMRRTWEGYL